MSSAKKIDRSRSGRGDPDALGDPLRMYLNEISRCPRYTREEEEVLARRIQRGDEEALRSLVRANLRFVVKIARKYRAAGVPLVDLISEGNVGLIEAAKRFDPDRGTKFITYAVWWIRQAILQGLADSFGAVRLPLKRHQLAFQLGRRFQMLAQELGRAPTPEELSEDMQIQPEVIRDVLRAARAALPLKAPRRDSDELGPTISMEDPDQIPAPALLEEMGIVEDVEELLMSIGEREREILRLHYGLGGDEPLTLQQIGDRYGLTRERIRQIELRAKEKLRVLAKARQLQEYLR